MRHTNIIYFFIGDVQKRQHIIIEYCPTDEMIRNFFTKPVGRAKFRHFHDIIMNVSHDEYGPVDVDKLVASHNKKDGKKGSTWYLRHQQQTDMRWVST